MPFTLYRYILKEMLKVLVLTASVMVIVLSFGAAIQPMSEGLLGPASVVKFVLYTMPTVLGFALPFAGAFAATLTFARLASDNEITACRASGMSYRTILLPVLVLGLVLMLTMLLLSNTIVPGFWKAAKRTVEGDVLAVLVARLNQSQPYLFDDAGVVLYSDYAELRPPPANLAVGDEYRIEKFIVLEGVAFGQFDRATGRVMNDTTARSASALMIRDKKSDRAYVTLRLRNPTYYDTATGDLRSDFGTFGEIDSEPIALPNPMEDEAVFFTLQELMALKHDPDQFDRVRLAKQELADAIAREQLKLNIREGLSAGEAGTGFVKLKGGLDNEYFRLSAPVVRQAGGMLILEANDRLPITIDRYDNAALMHDQELRFEATYGELRVQTGTFSGEPEVRLLLKNVRVSDPILDNPPNEHDEHEFAAMGWPGPVLGAGVGQMTSLELADEAKRPEFREVEEINAARGMLAYHIMRLTLNINAQVHARGAAAVACLLLLVLGALMALRLKGRTALVVFFWSFLLAVLTLLMIYTGQNLAGDLDPRLLREGTNWDHLTGLGVMWGGNLLTLFFVARIYLKVSRT